MCIFGNVVITTLVARVGRDSVLKGTRGGPAWCLDTFAFFYNH